MNSRTIITVETLAYGQPRPYEASRYTYRVTFAQQIDGLEPTPLAWGVEVATPYLRAIRNWEARKEDRTFLESYLDYAKQVEPGVLEFSVVSPYND